MKNTINPSGIEPPTFGPEASTSCATAYSDEWRYKDGNESFQNVNNKIYKN
jgi:hypothetical protein